MNPRNEYLGEVNLARGMYLRYLSETDAILLINRGNGGSVEDQFRPFLRGQFGHGGRFGVVTFGWRVAGGMTPDAVAAHLPPHGWFGRVMRSVRSMLRRTP